ncbi:MAG: LamG domain-containing protein, partial [Caulobacteraceae bacterium]|nr:LamG domain-containing protein [Caulobacteraceae bacterium]
MARAASAVEYFTGYLSNIRISNVIRSSTVPTSPLASDGNTKLLTCQSNRFVDNSTNNFTITPNGSPSVQAFSPFNPSASWSAATYGGSGYFDGNSDYLTVPQSAGALDLGSGQFSLEFWWYPTSATTGYPFIGDSTGNWYVGYESSNIVLGRRGVTSDVNTTGFTLVANTWQHFVITRQSTSTNDTRIFVNGVLRGVGTTSQNYTITTTLNIGGLAGGYVTGYLSSTNLVKGSVPAAYQTSSTTTGTQIFTPPTSPSTSVTGTQLLLNYTNAGIYDATSKNDLETVDGAKISTAISAKWG